MILASSLWMSGAMGRVGMETAGFHAHSPHRTTHPKRSTAGAEACAKPAMRSSGYFLFSSLQTLHIVRFLMLTT